MANTLRISSELKFTPDDSDQSTVEPGIMTMSITNTGADFTHGTQSIGTSEEEVAVSADIGTYGWARVKNLDATNYVEVGCITGQLSMKLKANEFCDFRCAANKIYAQANTAACTIEFWLFED